MAERGCGGLLLLPLPSPGSLDLMEDEVGVEGDQQECGRAGKPYGARDVKSWLWSSLLRLIRAHSGILWKTPKIWG